MSARRALAVCLAALALAACHTRTVTVENTLVTELDTSNDTMTADVGSDEGSEQAASFDGWTLSQRDDPMTDGHVIVLTTAVAGQVNDIELEVTCDPTARRFHYTIAGFNKQREGAPLAVDFNDGARHHVTYRVDGGRPDGLAAPVRYTNQIDAPYAYNFLTRGNRVVLQVPFTNSDETYVIDQSGETFRNAVARCQSIMDAADQAQRDQRAAALQQQQQQDAQPVTVNRMTGPGWHDVSEGPPTADGGEVSGWNSITTR